MADKTRRRRWEIRPAAPGERCPYYVIDWRRKAWSELFGMDRHNRIAARLAIRTLANDE